MATRQSTSSRSKKIDCWICHKFSARSLKSTIRHIGNVHSRDPNFLVNCGIGGCTQNYTNFTSFRSHVYRKHRSHVSSCSLHVESDNDHESDNSVGDLNVDDPHSTVDFDFKRSCALFILKCKEVYKISQSAIDGLVTDVTLLMQQHSHSVKSDIQKLFQDANITNFDIQRLLYPLEDVGPFKELHSKFLQEKYFRSNLHLIVSNNFFSIIIIINALLFPRNQLKGSLVNNTG